MLSDNTTLINQILDDIKQIHGFDFSGYHPAMLERRITNRLFATGNLQLHAYAELLHHDPKEMDHLLDTLTINVSRFFRDSFTFECISNLVIPEICQRKLKKGDPTLRIWSAGCASGEEAYTIGIIAKEVTGKLDVPIDLHIFATDIDQNILKKARQGVFSAESFSETKMGIIEKYFTKNNDRFEIHAEIRELIQFSNQDLLDEKQAIPQESVFADFDLVLCRNVLIYFNKEVQLKIFNNLYRSLSSDGLLVLGEAEIPVSSYKSRFRSESTCCKIYRKI
ncbi:MAG: protein-glutamate O-methyltransferase CheR [Bacteroidales bacterium]|nr:protein-glutamate O-methyltransferase CheR [Bacteroidales bacterium]